MVRIPDAEILEAIDGVMERLAVGIGRLGSGGGGSMRRMGEGRSLLRPPINKSTIRWTSPSRNVAVFCRRRREPARERGLTPLSVRPASAKGDILRWRPSRLTLPRLRVRGATQAVSDGALGRSGLTGLASLRRSGNLTREGQRTSSSRQQTDHKSGLAPRVRP